MKENICKICSNQKNNISYAVREMMFGFRDEFDYFECAKCGCLQITEVPANLSKYYPEGYYSLQQKDGCVFSKLNWIDKLNYLLRKQIVSERMGKLNLLGKIFSSKFHTIHWLQKGMINFNSNILDVGCGSGALILKMHYSGFRNVTGIDPFIKDEINYECGVTIRKKYLEEINEPFDFIMLHHSFEHMENPLDIFKNIYRLLKPAGFALIRIPVASSFAWRKYGINWVQLDAPRHSFLHTTKSIEHLANLSNLKLQKVIYDSSSFQFIGSEKYLRNIPLIEKPIIFSKKQKRDFQLQARKLNKINDGDAACFYLYKK